MRRLILSGLALTVAGCGLTGSGHAIFDMGSADTVSNPMSKSYSLTPFTLQPGEEKIQCYYVPPDQTDKVFNHITVDMAPGSHHLVVIRVKDDVGMPAYGPVDCINGEMPSLNTITGMLPGSQQPHSEYAFPDGVGMKIAKNEGIWFQSHYINATPAAVTTGVTWNITLADPATIQNYAGLIFYGDYGLRVPPGMTTSKMACRAPMDLHLLTATGHMHKRGIDFKADLNGTQTLFHTTDWSEPNGVAFPLPGVAVKTGDMINFACQFDNKDPVTYTFGNSAAKNEMCIFPALYYPSVNGATLFFCNP